MAYEHKEGQGSLFKNEKQNDRQPDYKGTILINGVTYEVAAWERTSQKGMQYLSLQAALPREKPQPAPSAPQYNSTPAAPAYSAPAPTIGDIPAFGGNDEEDLPF